MDQFSGNELDSIKWHGRDGDSEALEQVRELSDGVLDSRVRGPIDNHPSGMALNQLDIANPNTINTLGAKVKVNDAGLSGDVNMVVAGIEGFFMMKLAEVSGPVSNWPITTWGIISNMV